ncbi:MAG: pitrilysin family protein [Saprospiraceae bacterium]
MKIKILALLMCYGILCTNQIQGQGTALPAGVKKITSVEGITEYLIEKNGFRFLLFPDKSTQTITVNITYEVGSRNEGYGESGMAHLLEHMVFKGTPNHPNIPQELTSHGARPNGTTWLDRTNYFETFSATDENLKWALDLESDRMINSHIARKDLDTEFSVVRNEFESGENDPGSVLFERILSSAYLWHNYGKSTIGSKSDIEKVPIDNLKAFYQKYYQPDNSILLVTGKFDEAKTIAMVNEYFGKIPKPARVLQTTYTEEPVQDGERYVSLKRTGGKQVVACAYHIPSGVHPDAAAMDVLNECLSSEPAGRLYKALVESKIATSLWGWCAALRDPGFVYINVDVSKDGDLALAKSKLTNTLDSIRYNPITAEELDRAKTNLLKNQDDLFRKSSQLGLTLSEYIGMGDWRLVFLYRDHLREVSLEDVNRVARTYLKASNRTIGEFIPEENPERAIIPATPNVASVLKDYKGDAVIEQGEVFDPSPMAIEKRVTRVQDKGSVKYALLPKSTRGKTVNVNIGLHFGDENTLKGKTMIADMTSMMLDKGSNTLSRQEIKDKLAKLQAEVSFSGDKGDVNVSIQTTRENLTQALSIVNDLLKNPSFNNVELDKLKAEQITSIEEQMTDPTALAFRASQRLNSPTDKNDVRYVRTFEEEMADVKAIKATDLKKFHQEFYGGSNATFSVVGDFDPAVIKKVMVANYNTWKSEKPYKRIESKIIEKPAGSQEIETPDKSNAVYLVQQPLHIKDDNPDYAALLLGNYIFGGGFLNSRLAVRIRQKEGLSYGIGSMLSADAEDNVGSFMAYAIYNPENREKLEKAFKEEVELMLKDGFTAQEVTDAKSGYLQSRNVTRSQDPTLTSMLNAQIKIGRNMTFSEDLEQKIKALTPEQISAAMRKYIDLQKMSFIKAGDFAKLNKP